MTKCGLPKVENIKVLSGGNILIRPADDQTAKMIEQAQVEGLDISKAEKWRPRVLIYDIEKDITKEELTKAIVTQNPELGIDESRAEEHIKPVFMNGPKGRDVVWWIVETSPEAYKGLIAAKRVFVGFMSCRVKEYLNSTKCSKCQKFGHTAAYCKSEKRVCGWCAQDHAKSECPNLDKKPKCANCGKAFSANHKTCAGIAAGRKRAIRRTDYGRVFPARKVPVVSG